MTRTQPPPLQRSGSPLAGMMMMAAAMLVVPAMDVFAKLLVEGGVVGAAMPATQVAWARFLFQSLLVAPIALSVLGRAALRPTRPALTILRGFCIAAATALFFSALGAMPIADAIAIFFVEPLLLTALSAVLLRETIGWRRIVAVIVGLGGALLIIQPQFAAVGPIALAPLGAAAFFALYLALTKMLSEVEHPLVLHAWAGGAGTLALGALLLFGALWPSAAPSIWLPIAPSLAQWGILALLGLVATATHFVVVLAFRRAPASALAPLQYLEIVSATALGYWVFSDVPDASTWLGVAIIVGSGLFVIWREQIAAARRARADREADPASVF